MKHDPLLQGVASKLRAQLDSILDEPPNARLDRLARLADKELARNAQTTDRPKQPVTKKK